MIITNNKPCKCSKRVELYCNEQGRHRHVVITASSTFKERSVPSSLCRVPMSSMTVGSHASYLAVIRVRRVVAAVVEFGYRYRALIARPRNLGRLYDRNLRNYVVFLYMYSSLRPYIRENEVYVLERTTRPSVSCVLL